MRTGVLNVKGDLFCGTWQLISEHVVSAVQTSVSFSGLDGDTDEEYRLIVVEKSNYAQSVYIQPNGDSNTSHYGTQRLYGANNVVGGNRSVNGGISRIVNDGSNGRINLSDTIIKAKSGYVRTAISKSLNDINGTPAGSLDIYGGVWNNTVDNITSLVITSNTTEGIGVGTSLLLFKRTLTGATATTGIRTGDLNVKGSVKAGEMQKIYETTLTESATTVLISGLSGDDDMIYELHVRTNYNSSSAGFIHFLINEDSNNNNYGYQYIKANDTTIVANKANYAPAIGYCQDSSHISFGKAIIHASSGIVRLFISEIAGMISGTTVGEFNFWGGTWSNTADEITSISIFSAQSSGLGVGTHIELWALKKRT